MVASLVSALLLILCSAGLPAASQPGNETDVGRAPGGAPVRKRVLRLAQDSLAVWLRTIPPQQMTSFGFSSAEAFDQATVGDPVVAYHPTLGGLALDTGSLGEVLKSGPVLWYVPIESSGRVVALLEISACAPDTVVINGVGFSFLANRLQAAREQLAVMRPHGASVDAIVRIDTPQIDLVVAHDRADVTIWLRLQGDSTPTAEPLDQHDLLTLAEWARQVQEEELRKIDMDRHQ